MAKINALGTATQGTQYYDGTATYTGVTGTTGEVLNANTGAAPTFSALGVNSGLTAHSVLLGQGNSAITALGAATNGQLVIGSTGADPVLAAPSNGNNISWSTGAGSLTADVTGTTDHSILLGNATGSLSSLGVATNGQLPIGSTGANPILATLTEGSGISIANGAGSITISTAGGGFSWTTVSGTSQTISNNTGYINLNGSLTTFTLPTTAPIGENFIIVGYGSGGWRVAQNTGQKIYLGNTTSTVTTGTLNSTNSHDSIWCVCVVADTEWQIISSTGNITVS